MKVSLLSTSIALIVITALVGCQPRGNAEDSADTANAGSAPATESLETIDTVYQSPGKRMLAPIDVKYRLLDTPQVGQPLSLELTLMPTVATTGFGFTLNPEDGLVVDSAQLTKSFAGNAAMTRQTTTLSITPQREERFHLHVMANVVVNGQNKSRIITIPIQVGAGTRKLEAIGEVKTDADGNRIISLPATKPAE